VRTLKICLSLGRVKRIEEGLGNFFMGLARALIDEGRKKEKEGYGIEWHVHVRRQLHGCLGEGVVYHHASRLHRAINPIAVPIDVWHVLHQLNTLKPAWRTRRVLQTVHDLNFLYDADQSNTPHQIAKVSRLCKRTDEIVCISKHTASDLARTIAPHAPTSVIYNGVDDLTELPRTPIPSLQGVPFFFHLSRMTPNKNAECLLETARVWPEKRFVFAGPNTSDAQRLKTRFSTLPNVEFLGEVNESQKAWLYANCEVFLFPSFAEGFGLPPLEAMQFGTPVLISNRSSLPEISPETSGIVSSFDTESIKNAIIRLAHFFVASEVRASAIKHAKSFTWTQCARSYLDTYLRLTS
jgi:glycosyltransferase involved in cell wall biosynthesis